MLARFFLRRWAFSHVIAYSKSSALGAVVVLDEAAGVARATGLLASEVVTVLLEE
jgi:hypothetical protein